MMYNKEPSTVPGAMLTAIIIITVNIIINMIIFLFFPLNPGGKSFLAKWHPECLDFLRLGPAELVTSMTDAHAET